MPETLNEVLKVSIGTQQFREDLEQLKSLWQSFISEVGQDTASDLLRNGAFSGVVAGFNEIKNVLVQSVQELNKAIASMASQAEASVDKVASKAKGIGTDPNTSRVVQPGEKSLFDSRRERLGEAIEADAVAAEQINDKLDAKRTARAEKTVLESLVASEKISQNHIKENAKMDAADAKQAAERKAAAEKWIIDSITAQEKITQAYAKGDAKQVQEAEAALAKLTQIHENALRINAELDAKQAAERKEAAEKWILDSILSQEKITQAYEEAAAKQEAIDAKLASARERAAEKKRKAEEEANKPFVETLAGELARVARFAIEWQLVGAAINAATSILSAPFVALADGIKYLQDTERISEEISGVLLANVKYSNDITVNFEKAEKAAKAIVPALRQVAIRDNVKYENVQNTFDNVVSAGNGRGVEDTEGLIKLTEDFTVAFKALGINARTARTEIYNALNGTPANNSKFLEVVKMSAAEWVKVREEAYKAGTIVEVLDAKVAPFLSASQRAAAGQAELLEKLKLTKTQLEATFAAPLFDAFNKLLQEAAKWLELNRDKAEAWATALGKIPAQLLNLASSLQGVLPVAQAIGYVFGSIALSVSQLLVDVIFAVKSAAALQGLLSPNRQTSSEFKEAFDDWKKNQGDIINSGKDLFNLATGNYAKDGKDGSTSSGSLNDHIDPGPTSPNTGKKLKTPSEIPDELAKYRIELEALKAKEQEFVDGTKLAVTEHTKNWKDASGEIRGYIDEEIGDIDRLIAKYQKDITDKAKTPQEKQHAKTVVDDLTRQRGTLHASLGKTADSADKEDASEDEKIRTELASRKLNAIDHELRAQNALRQSLVKAGDLSEEEALAAQIVAEDKASTARQEIFQKEIEDKDSHTSWYIAQQTKMLQADADTTAKIKELGYERIEALRKEREAREQHAVELVNKQDQYKGVIDQVAASSRRNIDGEVFDKRRKDIDATILQKRASLSNTDALGAETAKTRQLENAIADLTNKRASVLTSTLAAISSTGDPAVFKQQYQRAALVRERSSLQGDYQAQSARAEAANNRGDSTEEVDKFKAQVAATVAALESLDAGIKNLTPSLSNLGDSLQKSIFGFDLLAKLQEDHGNATKQATDLTVGLAHAFTSVVGTLDAIKQGGRQGGVLGGIGAGISANAGLISEIPVVGPIIAALGPVFSIVGQMFMSATIRMANEVKAAISTTTTAYQEQSASLNATIQALQAERIRAVAELSGAKGGQEQLKNILPSLDQQIASLRIQQNQITTDFAVAFNALNINLEHGTDALSSVYTSWVNINKQVNDYINAGGDIATATAYLSAQLQKIQQDSQNSLNSGEQQAVQDAISLNNLLYQRTQLVQSLNQQAFALQNQDSQERTQSGAVTRAQQLADLERNSQKQLQDLDYQIQTSTLKINAENQVFTIASDIASLHREDDRLTLSALQLQLNQYKALQELIASISSSAGVFNSSLGFLQPTQNQLGTTVTLTGGLTVYVNVPAGSDPSSVTADSVGAALASVARGGGTVGY